MGSGRKHSEGTGLSRFHPDRMQVCNDDSCVEYCCEDRCCFNADVKVDARQTLLLSEKRKSVWAKLSMLQLH